MTFPVSITGISKRFGSVQALHDVDLQLEPGFLHGIVGENGAGKTTLMRILYGAIQPDSGRIALDGGEIRFSASHQAIAMGIGMVSQHYAVISELTCLQNLMLGAEGGPLLDLKKAERRAEELASKMGFQFEWNQSASGLGPAASQKLEILKLLWRNSRIMILDEPTAMLSPADGDALYQRLKLLAAQGATVVIVTHRLTEVVDHCSTVTVLRGGEKVGEKPVCETNLTELAQLVVGGAIAEPPPRTSAKGEPTLKIEGLSMIGDRGQTALRNVSLTIRSGEMVGIAGVDGSGQRELFQAITATKPQSSGSIALGSSDAAHHSTAARIASGLRVIPEDRQAEGIIGTWSLEENSALGLQRLEPFANGMVVDRPGRRIAASAIADRFATKHAGLSNSIESLSGGNQQRFVAARSLFDDPKLLVAFQPARGLDLNSTTQVYSGIRKSCSKGSAALIVSFDLDELLEYCDRILVMNRGQLLEPPSHLSLDRDAIGRLMVIGEA